VERPWYERSGSGCGVRLFGVGGAYCGSGKTGAVEAQSVLAAVLATVADLSTPIAPAAEIESFMPWVDAAAARHSRAHLRLFAS